jgi:hypothetical protein
MGKIIGTPNEPTKLGYWAFLWTYNKWGFLVSLFIGLLPFVQGVLIEGLLYPLWFLLAPLGLMAAVYEHWYKRRRGLPG